MDGLGIQSWHQYWRWATSTARAVADSLLDSEAIILVNQKAVSDPEAIISESATAISESKAAVSDFETAVLYFEIQ